MNQTNKPVDAETGWSQQWIHRALSTGILAPLSGRMLLCAIFTHGTDRQR